MYLTSPFSQTLEVYIAFYQKYVMFSPFQCLITLYFSPSASYRVDLEEIVDEEMSQMKCGTLANEGIQNSFQCRRNTI